MLLVIETNLFLKLFYLYLGKTRKENADKESTKKKNM